MPGMTCWVAERNLLGFGEEVVRIAIQHHPADRAERYQFFGHDLGRIEHVEAELFGLLLGEDLQRQFIFRDRHRLRLLPTSHDDGSRGQRR